MTHTTDPLKGAVPLPVREAGIGNYVDRTDALDGIARAYAETEATLNHHTDSIDEDYREALRVLAFADQKGRQAVLSPEAVGDGDVVDILIKGARVMCSGGPGFALVALDKGPQVTVPVDHPTVTVSRVAPQWWPPRPGDIIRTYHLGAVFDSDKDKEQGYPSRDAVMPAMYVARQLHDGEGVDMGVRLFPIDGENSSDGEDPHHVAKRSWRTPELVFRLPTTSTDETEVNLGPTRRLSPETRARLGITTPGETSD